MDLYYEQNVVNNNIDERLKRTKTLVVIRSVCGALGLFIVVSCALMIEYFWIFIILSFPFFAAAIIAGRINKRTNTEYDYVVDDEAINVYEIYFRCKRKLKHSVNLRLIESVGVFDSEGYKRAEHSNAKKLLALVNYDDEQSVMYILFNSEKGKKILFLEPDKGFITALRRAISSFSVFDKSIAELEKRLAQKELELVKQNAADDNEQTTIDSDAASATPNSGDAPENSSDGGEEK